MTEKTTAALAAGIAGSAMLTVLYETAKRASPNAPRMDRLGMNALAKIVRKTGHRQPSRRELFNWTLAGDLLGNAAYYSLVGVGKPENTWIRGAALGLAAGLGAVALPRPLGLDPAPSNRTNQTRAMTVALYTLGGLAAAAVVSWLGRRKRRKSS